MKLRDIVDAYGAQISAGFESGSYAAFAPAEETVGFIATDGSGARGIVFMCDRLRTDLDGTIRQAEYAGITGLELLDSGEGAYADELVIKTGGEPIRISDFSLEKHRLKALIEELRRAALAMSDNERDAVYSEAMLAAAEHFSQTAPVFAALPEIEIEKREAAIPDGYTPAQITEERIDWISGPRVRESEKAQESGAAVAAKPVGVAEAKLQPVGAPEAAAKPAGVPETAAQPAGAPEAVAQPAGVPETAVQPAGAHETAAKPTGVPETAAQPADVPETAAQPINAAQEAAPTAREVVKEIAQEMEREAPCEIPREVPQEEAPAEPPVIPEYFEEQEDLSELTHEQTLSYLLSSINEINAPAAAERNAQPQLTATAPIQQAQAAAPAVVQQEQAAPAQPLLTQEPVSDDIYIKASRKLREFCELGTLTQQGIEAAVKEGLIPAAEAFSQITAQKPAPPPLSERIAELKAASDNIDAYFALGEDVAARVMFFMLYQMLSYSDRLAELPETKARLNDFFRRWGAAGITLSMLDMRVQ